ncbi:MAG: amidohydrolase family protein [Acidobacteria bacterium]|nr:amidohydrolase family protein [Acidobacteriota bacterium]
MRLLLCATALLLAGCGSAGSGGSSAVLSSGTAIVGGTMIDGRGAFAGSVIIIAGSKIQAAGTAANIELPASVTKIDATGKYIIPAFVREPGADPLDELDRLTKGGMLPQYALATVTTMKAAKLNLEDLGSIEKGKRASLLILNGNPLTDAANFRKIEKVMINGTWGDVSKPYAN